MGAKTGQPTAKVALYCLCGGSMRGTVTAHAVPKIETIWKTTHNDPECGPTDSATCAKNRRKAERGQS